MGPVPIPKTRSFYTQCMHPSPECHECQAAGSNPWCRAWKAQGVITSQMDPVHTHLMRNWTSAERVSISLLFASSPIVTFTPSFTKSLSCKTQHVNFYSLHLIPWVSAPFSVFPSHSPPCPLLTLSSRIFCAPGPTQHEFILENGIIFLWLTFRWPLKTFLMTHM